MTDPGDPSDKIKVVDRRRFTENGEMRPDWKPPPAPASPEEIRKPPPGQPATDHEPGQRRRESAATGASSQTFLELIGTLAQQVELLLNGAQGLPPQPSQAQRLIDYLGVLETKTRGNLSTEEAQILSNVLFQLRSLFVQTQK